MAWSLTNNPLTNAAASIVQKILYPSAQLTPYGQGRASGAIPAPPAPVPAPQKTIYGGYTPPVSTSKSNAQSYSYSGGSAGGIPSYASAFEAGKQEAASVYDPYKKFLEQEQKNTQKRYKDYAKESEKNIPIIQERYKALLDQLNQNYVAQQGDINAQEQAQLGRQAARAGARGTFGSSAMEGGEQMITKEALNQLAQLAEGQRSKTQELSATQGLEEKAVYDAVRQMLLQGENRIGDLGNMVAGIPQEMFGAAGSYAGGTIDAAKAAEDAALQRYLASIRASESGGGSDKGTFREFVDEAGNIKQGYFVNGQLVQDIGGAVPGSTEERIGGGITRALQAAAADNQITPEEERALYAQFPYDQETVAQLVSQYAVPKQGRNIFQQLYGMFSR